METVPLSAQANFVLSHNLGLANDFSSWSHQHSTSEGKIFGYIPEPTKVRHDS